jgi:hypothetical protein
MNKNLLLGVLVVFFLFSAVAIPQISYCQTPQSTLESTPTDEAEQGTGPDLLLIGGVAAVVAAVVVVAAVFAVKRKRVNEKSLRKVPSDAFEDWVIRRFNGKPSDPSVGVNGFTEGGQPLLIKQSDVSLAEVEAFVDVLIRGKAKKGTVVGFNFDNDTLDGKVKAMDNEIDLQLLRVSELLNKRYASRIKTDARAQVAFTPSQTFVTTANPNQRTEAMLRNIPPNDPQIAGLKPRVFLSNSSSQVTDQVKKMLEFLHYDYVMGDKEETTVPISDGKLGLMKECDCAIINIRAAEQERRYSGLFILNPNVLSEINASYLKYNTQVILLVERKVELPPNLKGLKRIEYDTDDLSFNAAMDLDKELAAFKKI